MIKRFDPALATLAGLADPQSKNEKMDLLIQEQKQELLQLNERWQKALKLEQSGFFEGKSLEYQEKVCQELRQICARAGELWEIITEAYPHQKEELNALKLFDF